MQRPRYLSQIINRIESFEEGMVFMASDFVDIADNKTVHMSLSRLVDENKIKKVKRGVYCKPKFSVFLNEELKPNVDDVAHTIAKNFGWTIIPSGVTALNLLGLSSQVPAKWEYISDGPYKEYFFDNIKISFKHTNKNNELTRVSYKTAIVIRAIKALGQEYITDKEISIISRRLDENEKKILIKEAEHSTSWIYEIIKKICENNKDV